MTQYLSSIFIDPIIRQARRFSRPSNESEDPNASIRQHLPAISHARVGVGVGVGAAHHDQVHLVLEDVEPSLIQADDLDDVSTQFSRGTETEFQPWRSREDTSPPSRHVEFSPETPLRMRPATSYSYQPDDDTSDNPLYGIPDSFRSTESSFSNSTMSGIDTNIPSTAGFNDASRSAGERAGNYSSRGGGKILPADDGRSSMRKRILAVQGSDLSTAEKARLIHEIMTEKYNLLRSSRRASRDKRPLSPSSLLSQEQPCTPPSVQSMDDPPQAASPPLSLAASCFHLSPDDLKPTYHLQPLNPGENGNKRDSGSSDTLDELPVLGCPHYKRNVKLQCSACERWYTCRFCHDDKEDHSLVRRETRHMLCMLCGHAQAASEECRGCGEIAARYYCDVCKLWDDDPQKSIYHCNDCGICRVGQGLGKDFFHCEGCSACVSMAVKESHRCIERSTECDCPICGEYMFNSPRTVVFMPCGHSIHQRCYYDHMNTSYRCPICSRSVVNMDVQFRHLQREIESQPMPPQFQDTVVRVYCNDCSAKTTVKYHWIGLKCAVCDSFNTAQIQIHRSPESVLPPSRGRAPEITGRPLRPAASISALDTTRTPAYVHFPRNARSHSPNINANRLSASASASTSDPADSMNTDEEYDDVDFWGGESPTNWARSSLLNSRREGRGPGRANGNNHEEDHVEQGDNEDEDDNYDDDEDDDEDERMSDETDDDWNADEDEEVDRMDIFGHR